MLRFLLNLAEIKFRSLKKRTVRQAAGEHMTVNPSQGAHVLLDYVNANFEDEAAYRWLFSLMREAVRESSATEVHATLLL